MVPSPRYPRARTENDGHWRSLPDSDGKNNFGFEQDFRPNWLVGAALAKWPGSAWQSRGQGFESPYLHRVGAGQRPGVAMRFLTPCGRGQRRARLGTGQRTGQRCVRASARPGCRPRLSTSTPHGVDPDGCGRSAMSCTGSATGPTPRRPTRGRTSSTVTAGGRTAGAVTSRSGSPGGRRGGRPRRGPARRGTAGRPARAPTSVGSAPGGVRPARP